MSKYETDAKATAEYQIDEQPQVAAQPRLAGGGLPGVARQDFTDTTDDDVIGPCDKPTDHDEPMTDDPRVDVVAASGVPGINADVVSASGVPGTPTATTSASGVPGDPTVAKTDEDVLDTENHAAFDPRLDAAAGKIGELGMDVPGMAEPGIDGIDLGFAPPDPGADDFGLPGFGPGDFGDPGGEGGDPGTDDFGLPGFGTPGGGSSDSGADPFGFDSALGGGHHDLNTDPTTGQSRPGSGGLPGGGGSGPTTDTDTGSGGGSSSGDTGSGQPDGGSRQDLGDVGGVDHGGAGGSSGGDSGGSGGSTGIMDPDVDGVAIEYEMTDNASTDGQSVTEKMTATAPDGSSLTSESVSDENGDRQVTTVRDSNGNVVQQETAEFNDDGTAEVEDTTDDAQDDTSTDTTTTDDATTDGYTPADGTGNEAGAEVQSPVDLPVMTAEDFDDAVGIGRLDPVINPAVGLEAATAAGSGSVGHVLEPDNPLNGGGGNPLAMGGETVGHVLEPDNPINGGGGNPLTMDVGQSDGEVPDEGPIFD